MATDESPFSLAIKKVSIFRERFRGYQAAMRDHNLPVPEEYIIEVPSDVEQGKAVHRRTHEASESTGCYLFVIRLFSTRRHQMANRKQLFSTWRCRGDWIW